MTDGIVPPVSSIEVLKKKKSMQFINVQYSRINYTVTVPKGKPSDLHELILRIKEKKDLAIM